MMKYFIYREEGKKCVEEIFKVSLTSLMSKKCTPIPQSMVVQWRIQDLGKGGNRCIGNTWRVKRPENISCHAHILYSIL